MAKSERFKRRGAPVSPAKAKKILREGTIRGHALTGKQEGYFGLLAGGGTPTRTKRR